MHASSLKTLQALHWLFLTVVDANELAAAEGVEDDEGSGSTDPRGDMDADGPIDGTGLVMFGDGNGENDGGGDGTMISALICISTLHGEPVVPPPSSLLWHATTSQILLSVYSSGRYSPIGSE